MVRADNVLSQYLCQPIVKAAILVLYRKKNKLYQDTPASNQQLDVGNFDKTRYTKRLQICF